MGQTKHTPGPWFDWEAMEWLVEPRRLLERTEDARLIAAAPALLEGLSKYMAAVDLMNAAMRDGINVHGAVSMLVGAEAIARDAIEKATK
jgi:hypothetical protein